MSLALAIASEQHVSPPLARINGKLREAVRLMVEDSLTRQEAALKAGITDHALYCALRKPHVASLRNELMEVLRTSEASRTISRAAKLADAAESEHVRLQANTWLAGIEGISPVTKSENINIHKGLMPGLTIIMGGHHSQAVDARVLDGLAHEIRTPIAINRIGQSVPHPDAVNVVESEPLPEKTKTRRRKPGRGK